MTMRPLIAAAAGALLACIAAAQPVNSACPISGKAFEEPAATLDVDGHTIGFCCPGCMMTFQGWSDEKKAAFIEHSLEAEADAAGAAETEIGDPYPLPTCAFAPGKLGSMGDPVVMEYDGREVRYCCASCIERFEKDLPASLAKVDAKIIKTQTPYYPLKTCVHCETALPNGDGDAAPVDFVYRNRLLRTCSDDCREAVLKNPAPAWKRLDAAVVQAQRPHYPLETCAVAGETLGSMGQPHEVVVANRLVLLCCAGCEEELYKNAPAVIEKIDAAWTDKYGDQQPEIAIERVESADAAEGS